MSAELYKLLVADLDKLNRRNLSPCLAVVIHYPNDSHYKALYGAVLKEELGPSLGHFCDVTDHTVTDCFVFGPQRLALDELRMVLLSHTLALKALFGVERQRLVPEWMMKLARTDAGFKSELFNCRSEDTLKQLIGLLDQHGLTARTVAAIPNIIAGSCVLARILSDGAHHVAGQASDSHFLEAPEPVSIEEDSQKPRHPAGAPVPASDRTLEGFRNDPPNTDGKRKYRTRDDVDLYLQTLIENGDTRVESLTQVELADFVGCAIGTLKSTLTYRNVMTRKRENKYSRKSALVTIDPETEIKCDDENDSDERFAYLNEDND